jgi:hypothetical protein
MTQVLHIVPTVPGSIRDLGGNPRKWTIIKHQWADTWILMPPARSPWAEANPVHTVPSHRAAILLMDRLRCSLADVVGGQP